MNFKKTQSSAFIFLLILVLSAEATPGAEPRSTQTTVPVKTTEIERISAEELKAKIARNQPVTIIDVRSTNSYADSDNRIKGAIHVKLRRLKYRLGFPPLKNVLRDREIVTYCACPSDESALSAAQVLIGSGFMRVRALKGGWQEWLKVSGQVEPRPKGM